MGTEFLVRPKNLSKTETSVTMTIRIDRELQQKYDELSAKSGHSRNELMAMALQYAIDNLHFVDKEQLAAIKQLPFLRDIYDHNKAGVFFSDKRALVFVQVF